MSDQAPNIFPFLRYADADAARDWLSQAFGFKELAVYRNDEDVIHHAEMSLGPGVVMFGQGDPGEHGIYIYVEDVESHYERAKAAGAEIVRELEDTPYESREYTAKDPEGNVWSFGSYQPHA